MGVYTQQEILQWNRLDDVGTLLDLQRNPGESNSSYRQRILRVYVERAGAHYDGLINALNNEFGLTKFMCVTLTSTLADYSVYVTASRVMFISGDITESYYYKYTQQDAYVYCMTLEDLCLLINESDYWHASVSSDYEHYTSECLMIQSNTRNFNQIVPSTNRIALDKTNLVSGTLSFDEKDIFKIEIPFDATIGDPYDLLTVDGDYTVDYSNGVIYTKLTPRGYGAIDGYYKELPYQLVGTPCNVYSFDDSEFLDALYMQTTGNEYTPSHDLLRYIRELYVVANQTWGK